MAIKLPTGGVIHDVEKFLERHRAFVETYKTPIDKAYRPLTSAYAERLAFVEKQLEK